MSANHSLLKKLGTLRDKLELRRDDVAVGESPAEEESESGASGEDDATEDIEQIATFQHKILRKYAMLGFIRYSASRSSTKWCTSTTTR